MTSKQNRSTAVMNRRAEPTDSLDDFPTPPWATRAFLNELSRDYILGDQSVWEPACGRGYMARVLEERFGSVIASDIHDYGQGSPIMDFTASAWMSVNVGWIITNPPFKLGPEFIRTALGVAKIGVAMLVRTNFLEGIKRYEQIYSIRPPTFVLQYAERVPMVKGRVDPKATSATSYCWLVWVQRNSQTKFTSLDWIGPSRKKFERDGDYHAL